MITIDGSTGEGGGQILRTALALSLVTGEPFRIDKIRAGRKKPGLLRQHLTAVNAATQIGQANVTGATLGSQTLLFEPGKIRPGDYSFAVGTAGSATLVLQTVLPALLVGITASRLVLEGGTHNPFAPPFDFLQKTFIPILNRMGAKVSVTLERHGFYPAGGGKFTVTIEPASKLCPIELLERGTIKRQCARAVYASLTPRVAERELQVISEKLGWPAESLHAEPVTNATCPGNVLLVEVESDGLTEVFTGFGERGVQAEKVAESVVDQVREYLVSKAPVGEHLADQLLLPMALAGRGSFNAVKISRHAQTNIETIQKFLPVEFKVEKMETSACVILKPK